MQQQQQQHSSNEQPLSPIRSPFPTAPGAGGDVAAVSTSLGFFGSSSLPSPVSTVSHISSPASSLSSRSSFSSSSASAASPSAVAESFFHFPPAPSPPLPTNKEEYDGREPSDADFSTVVGVGVRSLDARIPVTATPLPLSMPALTLSTASAPAPVSPKAQWPGAGRLTLPATHPVRSRLRASAPPFQLQPPSASTSTNTGLGYLRFPSSSFPVLPSQLASHEQHWGSHSDTRKVGLDGGSGNGGLSSSPLHSFSVVTHTALRGVASPAARRPVTPGLSSALNVSSSPFTPYSAPTQSRSLREPFHTRPHSVTTPITPTSTYSPLLASASSIRSSSSSLLIASTESDTLSSSTAIDESLFDFVPQQPLDVPSDRDFLHEQPTHSFYMFAFRTSVCPLYRSGNNCPNDAYTCFYAHSKLPRRRSPILHHGRYNYIPTRCRYLLEDRDCPKGAQCRFAHVTEEVIYHPSKYKTQLCSHAVDENGCCTGYGMHCAKAHSEEDRRQPVYEAEEGQPRRWTTDNFYEFQCPPEEREQGQLTDIMWRSASHNTARRLLAHSLHVPLSWL